MGSGVLPSLLFFLKSKRRRAPSGIITLTPEWHFFCQGTCDAPLRQEGRKDKVAARERASERTSEREGKALLPLIVKAKKRTERYP